MKYEAKVSDVMETNVKTMDIDDPIQKAAEVMAANRIGSVLIMGEKNLKGIVTAEDIVYKHVAKGEGEKVSDIMTRDPITTSPDTQLDDAARVMSEKRIKKLPVVDASGKVVGIVTASDIVRIAPALHDILLEQLKITSPGAPQPPRSGQMFQCEMCNNYSDDVSEVDGVWICPHCDEMKTGPKGEKGV